VIQVGKYYLAPRGVEAWPEGETMESNPVSLSSNLGMQILVIPLQTKVTSVSLVLKVIDDFHSSKLKDQRTQHIHDFLRLITNILVK
jgi:hypothetical protein